VSRPLADSFRDALAGLAYAWRTQRNLRIQVLAAAGVLVALVLLRLPPVQAGVLILAVVLVLAAELFNTAVEVVVDHFVGPEHQAAARVAKDVAAAAVVVTAVGAAAVGALILLPRIR